MTVEIGVSSKNSGYFLIGSKKFDSKLNKRGLKLNNIDDNLETKRCMSRYGRVIDWNIGGWRV